jgi:hypothetical protein
MVVHTRNPFSFDDESTSPSKPPSEASLRKVDLLRVGPALLR